MVSTGSISFIRFIPDSMRKSYYEISEEGKDRCHCISVQSHAGRLWVKIAVQGLWPGLRVQKAARHETYGVEITPVELCLDGRFFCWYDGCLAKDFGVVWWEDSKDRIHRSDKFELLHCMLGADVARAGNFEGKRARGELMLYCIECIIKAGRQDEVSLGHIEQLVNDIGHLPVSVKEMMSACRWCEVDNETDGAIDKRNDEVLIIEENMARILKKTHH